MYIQSEISHILLYAAGQRKKKKAEREEKTACSSCLRMFEASQPVGGRFLGGNRGITARCHTPKYSAYRDINRSRGKTDRQSCGLSAIAVQDERADALTHTHKHKHALTLTTQPDKMSINRYDRLN